MPILKFNRKSSEESESDDLSADNKSDKVVAHSWRQIKYLPKFLSPKEKLVIKAALVVIVVSILALGFIFLNDHLVEKPSYGGIYTENIVGAPKLINPLYDSINEADRDLSKLIFASLVRLDENQEISSDLAKEWYQDEDNKKYTFILRDDIYWPDEKQFTSEDVIFTFQAIQNEAYKSSRRANWVGIKVTAIDEFTVQFELPEPYRPFLENLASVGILPVHLWMNVLPENANLAELNIKPVGLGPYQVEEFARDKQGYILSYTLTANKNYHLGRPYIDKVTFKFQPTFEAAADSLKNRNADGMNFLPLNLKETLSSRNDINYYSLSLPQYTAVFFNQDKNEALKVLNFRNALSLAIDKEMIVNQVLGGEARAIDNPLLPGFPGFDETKTIKQANADAAETLLDELGYKRVEITQEDTNKQANTEEGNAEENNTGENQIESLDNGLSKYRFKNNAEISITLTTSNQPQNLAAAEMIQKMWEAIGVRTYLNIVDSNQIQSQTISTRDFEALLFGEILGADPDFYAFWHSSQVGNGGLNLANYKNTEVDKLLEDMRTEEDEEKLSKLYTSFAKKISASTPAILIYNPNYTYAISNKVKGINLARITSSTDRLNGLYRWYIKTKKGFK